MGLDGAEVVFEVELGRWGKSVNKMENRSCMIIRDKPGSGKKSGENHNKEEMKIVKFGPFSVGT